MVGFIKPVPRALVPGYCKAPIDYVYCKGFIVELREYEGEWYAYGVDGGSPQVTFSAIRYGIYSTVEHQELIEIALELLEQ